MSRYTTTTFSSLKEVDLKVDFDTNALNSSWAARQEIPPASSVCQKFSTLAYPLQFNTKLDKG